MQKGKASSFPTFIISIQNSREVDGGASSFPPSSFLTPKISGHIWARYKFLDALSGTQWLWKCNGDMMDKMTTPLQPHPFPSAWACYKRKSTFSVMWLRH
eukprot:4967384-Ditylum_brightwellii.AAC.1